ncbi:hypothetical protein MNBD_PLANCTO02-1623 [hydrothermal vent metagenome]|uniref:Uncharacterized protein n=1 Tax=hydrothermal vent metagenome TaxID=652676 RepID=A0A3B1DLM1_9ZZZZ
MLLISVFILHGDRLSPVVCAEEKVSQKVPSDFSSPIHRILVPANQPGSWLTKNWHPIPLQDYETFLLWRKNQQSGPQPVQMRHVQYSAFLAGSTLQKGTFRADVFNSQKSSQLMSLGETNLVMTSLVWEKNKQKVIWGETGSGNTVLLVPPGQHKLNGTWSLQGKQKTRSVQFDLEFIPSAVNRLNLLIPVGQILKSTSGEIIGPLPSKKSGKALWYVEPGSETTCQLTVQQTDNVTLSSPLVLMKHDVSFVARRDEMSFQADLNPQVYHRPIEKILVNISSRLTIHTVTYGGDFPLSWKIHNKKKQRQLEIKLTDPLLGAGRPIRIEGTLPFSEYREQILPTFQYPDAYFLEGRLHLQIDPPLKLRSYRPQGYLQTGVVFDAVAGETSTFQQYRSDAKMVVQISPPPLRMKGRLLSRLTISNEKAELNSWLNFTIQKGNTFSLECELPRDWSITHVVSQQKEENPSATILNWNVISQIKETQINDSLQHGNQRLRIEFRDAIVPGTEHRIFIQAHRNNFEEETLLQLPFITPQNINPLEGWVVVEHSSQLTPQWEQLEDIQVVQNLPENVTVPSLPEQVKTLLNNSLLSTKTKRIIFEIEGENASGELRFGQQDAANPPRTEDGKNPTVPQDSSRSVSSGFISSMADVPVWGELQTELGVAGSPFDQNDLTYRFPSTLDPLQFQLTLPANTIFKHLRVNGKFIEITPEADGTIPVPLLPKNQANFVSVRYFAKIKSNWLSSQHDIPLPHINHQLVNLHWDITLTKNQSMTTKREQIPLHHFASRKSISWMNRYLGPMGRKATSTLFNPFSVFHWNSLFAGQNTTQKTSEHFHQSLNTPVGWVNYHADISVPPEQLTFSVQNQSRVNAFAWFCFWGSLLGGMILRRIGWRWRAGLGTFWLVANILFAYLVSSSIAEIFGANISGTILAILIPIRLVRLSRKPTSQNIPMGSTVAYINAPLLMLLFSFLLFSVNSFAQEQSDILVPRSSEKKSNAPPTAMLSVDANRQPAGGLPIIYLNPPLMQQFTEYLQQQKKIPQYLISEARYTGIVRDRKEITFVAEYEIILLDSGTKDDVFVHLPITNANLGGSNACLVDGETHPILRHKTGIGYLVQLKRDSNASSSKQEAAKKFSVHQIKLQLHPRLVSTEEGTELRMEIPSVIKSQLSIESKNNISIVRLVPAVGNVVTSKNKTKLTAKLGKTKRLRVLWKSNTHATPEALLSQVEISPATVVELHSGWVQVRSLIRTRLIKGKINSLHLKLPTNAVLKEVVTNLKYEQSKQLNSKKETLLSIDFFEAQEKDFQVEILFDLPLSKGASVIAPLDYFNLPLTFQTLVSQKVQYNISPHLIAVIGPKEFKVTSLQPPPDNASAISVESFLNDVPRFSETRNLTLAFSMAVPTLLSFQLEPKFSMSTVYTNQTALFGLEKMTWTFNAEVETKDVPAYRHRIQISPRLIIQSISVKEDDAERLVRWSRKGSVITLVLNGQTLGTQDVTIQGEMRIPGSGICRVPLIHFQEATVAEANLHLYHSKDVRLSPLGKPLVLEKEISLTKGSSMLGRESLFYGKMLLKATSISPWMRVSPLNRSRNQIALLTKLQILEDKKLQVDTFIQIPPSQKRRQTFQLRLPKQWGDQFGIESKGYQFTTEKEEEGALVTCTPLSQKRNMPLLIHLHKTIPAFIPNQVNAFAVVKLLLNNELHNELLIPRNQNWKVVNNNATKEEMASLNSSLIQKININSSSSSWQLYQKNETTPWKIETNPLGISHEILSFHTEVSIQKPNVINGRTKVLILSKNSNEVQLSCPAQINLQGLVINGQAQKLSEISRKKSSATEFTLSIPISKQINSLLLIWSLPLSEQQEKESLPYPVFKKIPPQYQTITYHSSSHTKFMPPHDNSVQRVTPLQRDLFELTELSKALSKQISSPKENLDILPLRNILIRSFDQFNKRYHNEITRGLKKEAREKFNTIQAIVVAQEKTFKSPVKQQVSEMDFWMNNDDFLGSAEGLIYQVLPNQAGLPAVKVYRKQNNFVVIVLVIVLLLITFPVAYWLFRLELYEWFNRFPLLAWGLGAFFWWFFLTASFGGFCLILLVSIASLWSRLSNHREHQKKIL